MPAFPVIALQGCKQGGVMANVDFFMEFPAQRRHQNAVNAPCISGKIAWRKFPIFLSSGIPAKRIKNNATIEIAENGTFTGKYSHQ